MEKSLFIAIAVGAVLAIGVNASVEITFKNSCECNNNICHGVENNTAIPNEANCEQFFLCIDGRPIPNTCPPGQWFNYTTSLCDDSPSPCAKFECPPDGIHFFPHEEHCDMFIMCFAGFAIEMSCAEGLHFDRELGQCNFPEYAECELEICPPKNDPDHIVFLPSDRYCDKYFICYAGEPIKFRCPEGLHFNPNYNTCDFIENANCTIEEPEEPEGPPQPHEIDCESDESIDFVAHPNSCEHYFICFFGQSILLDCAPGFWFDTENFWCDHPESVKCEANTTASTASPTASPTDSDGYLPPYTGPLPFAERLPTLNRWF